jgi:signal transduction histidine kinase
MVDLRLEDNGRGFPGEGAVNKGIGLLAIREHAEALGGTCDISSRPTGVRIRLQFPLGAD